MTVVWGVDPSTVRLSIAWTDGHTQRGVRTHSFDTGWRHPGARLAGIKYGAWDLARRVQFYSRPDLVLVEQPFGRNVDPIAYMAVGAVLTGLAEQLGKQTRVELVPVPTWKKQAWSDAPAELRDGLWRRSAESKAALMRLARSDGYSGRLQDEADAWGIARAALSRAAA